MPSRSTLAEVVGILLAAVVVLGGLALYAQTWPPAVIVESGSMMHPHEDTPFGRFGTIDPGDIVMLRRVRDADDVALAAEGVGDRHGGPGDVIVFLKDGDPRGTPIIHRAVTFVDVRGSGDSRTYRVWWDGEWRAFGPQGIRLPELGFAPGAPCCPDGRYRPAWSGFITRGDNPDTNPSTDQSLLIAPEPVPLEWVRGVARAEIPWLGLPKLALAREANPHADGWLRIGNAYAPRDCWAMLFVSLGVFLAAPVAYDAVRRRFGAA